jgi:hypothetical protein
LPRRSLKKYDIAGDGIATRDFVTTAAGPSAGAGALEFCKAQCAATPECEFSVTQGTKCYLKGNLQGGNYGKTGASPLSDAACIKGADNWLKFALQVSNLPASGAALPGAAGGPVALPPRRNVTGRTNGAGGGREAGRAAAMAAVAGLGGWLLAGLLV